MQDLRFYNPILKLVGRAFTPYSKKVRAILIFIIMLVAGKHAGRYLLFLITGALSVSLAIWRLILDKIGFVSPYVFSVVVIGVTVLSAIVWLIATFSITRHFKLEYSSVSKAVLPFLGLLNIFAIYVVIGTRVALYSALVVFVSYALIYYKVVFLKKVNYKGKEFVFWNLYNIPADELVFPVEVPGRLDKYKITLQDDTRNAIVSPNAPGFFSKPIKISSGDSLDFSIGLAEKAFSGTCIFEIYASIDHGPEDKIFSHHLNPAAKIVDQTWKEFKIDMTPYNKKEVVLRFKTRFENTKQPIDAYWEFPRLMHNKRKISVSSSAGPDVENIIILVMDAMRFDLFQRVASLPKGLPNISSFFSRDSIYCSRAITQNDWTMPAFASILSGRYAVHHQHFVSRPLRYQRPISNNLQWLPKILQEKGYLTRGFSDYCEINPAYGFARGFDSFYNGENIEEIDHGEKVSLHGLRFLRENENRKKFLFLHYFSTHRPFKTRYPYRVSTNPNFSNWFNTETLNSFMATSYHTLKTEDKQAIVDVYCSAIAQADQDLSIIFDYLISKKQVDKSLVILTADHGYSLFDRGSFSPKVTAPYEEIVHIPFFARMPAGVLRGDSQKIVDDLIEANVDIFPTTLDAIGLKDTIPSDGKSILKLIKGEVSSRKYTISELYDTKSDTYMLAIRGERYKLISTYNFDASRPFTFRAVQKREELLFDLFADPGEKRDISKEKQEILLEFRKIEEAFSRLHK